MNLAAQQTLDKLKTLLRPAALAQIGGIDPPEDPCTSWFGRGVCLPDESLPVYNGKEMIPLLQINIAELPYTPPELAGTALLVVYFWLDYPPVDQPHGEGWLIREYASLEHLVPLPALSQPNPVLPFPIRWSLIEDAPGWDNADILLNGTLVYNDPEFDDAFSNELCRYETTKVGGYPTEVQSGGNLEGYVFQIGSEEKTNWN